PQHGVRAGALARRQQRREEVGLQRDRLGGSDLEQERRDGGKEPANLRLLFDQLSPRGSFRRQQQPRDDHRRFVDPSVGNGRLLRGGGFQVRQQAGRRRRAGRADRRALRQ